MALFIYRVREKGVLRHRTDYEILLYKRAVLHKQDPNLKFVKFLSN